MTNNLSSRNWVYLLLLGLFLWLLYTYREVVGPLVIAALLAYLVNPVVTLLRTRARLSHHLAVNVVYAIFLLVLISSAVVVVPLVIRQSSFISAQVESIQQELVAFQPALGSYLGFEVPIEQVLAGLLVEAGEVLRPERVFRVLLSATTNLVWVAVILVTSYYLLRDWERLREWLFGFVPPGSQADLRKVHEEIKAVWQAYLRGQMILMLVVGLLSGLAAGVVGLRGYVVLGLLAGGLVIIPNLGPALATIAAAVIAWTQGSNYLEISNFWLAVTITGLFMGIQFVEGVWLQPQIMGRRLNLHPVLIFVAIISTLTLVGALATLIVIPLIATGDIIFRYTRRRLSGIDPWA